MPDIELVVEVSELNVPKLRSIGTVVAGPGKTEVRWSLITINQHNSNQATFASPGIELPNPLPEDVTPTTLTSGSTEWEIELDNQRGTSDPDHNLQYIVRYNFDGVLHTEDPVIVVTSEPV